jgi:hypothetical protein
MMMREDQKQQAFPDDAHFGISIRDYFAARALQGMLAGQDRRLVASKEFIGETAYEYADLMLKARES